MTRGSTALLVGVITLAGIWGCAQKTGEGEQAERIRVLERKCARLQDELGRLTAERDRLREEITVGAENRLQLREALEVQEKLARDRSRIATEREALRGERDSLRVERDSLMQAQECLQKAHDAIGKEMAVVTGEREALQETVRKLTDEQDVLLVERDLLAGEVDILAQTRRKLVKEREELLEEVGRRVSEREALQIQLSQVRRGLRTLLGQAEASLAVPMMPAVAPTNSEAAGDL